MLVPSSVCLSYQGVGMSPVVGTAEPATALIAFVLIKSSSRHGRALCRCSCPPTNSLRGHTPLEFNIAAQGWGKLSRAVTVGKMGGLRLEISFLVKKRGAKRDA